MVKYVVKMKYMGETYYLQSPDDMDCYGDSTKDAARFNMFEAGFHSEQLTRAIIPDENPPVYYICPVVTK